MIISISRELGAGGLTIGQAIADAIGAQLLDERTIIGKLSERLGLSEHYVAGTVERPRTFADALLIDIGYASAMMGPNPFRPNDEELIDGVRALVAEYAASGNVVVIGHGGPALLKDVPRVQKLTLLLHAGRDWRITHVAARFAIDAAEARRRIERVDKARENYARQHFGRNLYEARDYDVVLNTEFLGLETATAVACMVTRAAILEATSR
jgi:cytidylate kinase